MTKTYALKRLLEHGPMNLASIRECTIWSRHEVRNAVRTCLKYGEIRRLRAAASSKAKYDYEAMK